MLKMETLKVGDIIYNSWGYDQTNIDFYQVISKTEKSVKLRMIKKETEETGFMCGHCIALKNQFTNRPSINKRIKYYKDKISIHFSFGCGSKWNGEKLYFSWYA